MYRLGGDNIGFKQKLLAFGSCRKTWPFINLLPFQLAPDTRESDFPNPTLETAKVKGLADIC